MKNQFAEIQEALAEKLHSTYASAMLKHFGAMLQSYLTRDWESCCTKSGKFVEALLKGIHYHTTGERLTRISVGGEIDRLANLPQTSHNESVRLLIPRVCRTLYQIASDRGARHDITGYDASRMDAEIAMSSASYLLAELIRLFHPGNLTPDAAKKIIDRIVQRRIPLVTSVFDVKRVLNPKLAYEDKVLLLLYDSYPEPVSMDQLFGWVEYKNITRFKKKILRSLHDSKYIEYHDDNCVILEPGLQYVEENLFPSL